MERCKRSAQGRFRPAPHAKPSNERRRRSDELPGGDLPRAGQSGKRPYRRRTWAPADAEVAETKFVPKVKVPADSQWLITSRRYCRRWAPTLRVWRPIGLYDVGEELILGRGILAGVGVTKALVARKAAAASGEADEGELWIVGDIGDIGWKADA
jgi:hypothetical protein